MLSIHCHQTGSQEKPHIKKTKSFGAWKEQIQKARPRMLSETKANVTIVAVIDIQTMVRKMDGERNVQPRMQNAWIASRRDTSEIHIHVSLKKLAA